MRVSKRLENKSQMKRKNTRRLIIESDSDMSDSQSDSDFNCDENEMSESEMSGSEMSEHEVSENEDDFIDDTDNIPLTEELKNKIRNMFNPGGFDDDEEEQEEEELIEKSHVNFQSELKKFYKEMDIQKANGDKIANWKDQMTEEDIIRMTNELSEINRLKKNEALSVIKILSSKLDISKKKELVNKFVSLFYHEPYSTEYENISEYIKKELNEEKTEIEKKLSMLDDLDNSTVMRNRILELNTCHENLSIIYNKFKRATDPNPSADSGKQMDWVRSVMKVPFGKYSKLNLNGMSSKEVMLKVRQNLDNKISYLEEPKDEIINIVSKYIQNPERANTNAIAIYGSPGVGKTSLVREGIAKALNRPFRTIQLGGAKDSSYLVGHSYTYEGSTCGRIVNILKETGCMNPIIYLDELDKISDTPQGQEIIGVLTHLIDPSQNGEFYDNYFGGVKFDLSKVLFIFSYNNSEQLDSILSDRINKIKVTDPDVKHKVEIAKKHLLPGIYNENNLTSNDILISDEVLRYIVLNYTEEKGCRQFKRCLSQILSRINTLNLCGNDCDIIKMDYNKIEVNFPMVLNTDIVTKLIKKPKNQIMNHHIYM